MRLIRYAMLALLAGVVACTSYSQTPPYGGYPPGTQGQNNPDWRYPDDQRDYDDWRDPDDPYDNRSGDDWYHNQTPDMDVGFFYNELSPYGEWVRHPRYGWVWFPRHVRAGWRPYSIGRWVRSDWGWMWVSNEPFGWATYHYGRWAWDRYVGWLWVPGTDWGPAWVAWQHGNGYVGWAPLPPQVGFQMGVGIQLGGFNLSFGFASHDWAFVQERRFLHSGVNSYIVPQARNVTIIQHTTNVTNYTVVNNRVINQGVPVERIEQVTGTTAPRVRVATASDPRNAGVQRDVVTVYRPTKSKLETVRVAPRNNAGLPQPVNQPGKDRPQAQPTARPQAQPATVKPPEAAPTRQRPASVPIPVAPRAKPEERYTNESEFQKEQKALRAAEEKQRKALEQIHRQELAQAQAKADAADVAKRQADELQAQREMQQRAEKQLQTRQQIERQAAEATAAAARKAPRAPAEPTAKPDKGKDEKKNDDKKNEDKKNDENKPQKTD